MLNRILGLFGYRLVPSSDIPLYDQFVENERDKRRWAEFYRKAALEIKDHFWDGSRPGSVGVTDRWDANEYLKRLREERAESAKFFDLEVDPVVVTDEESDAEKHRMVPA